MWSSVFTTFPPGIEPRAVAWQSIALPLHHASFTTQQPLATKHMHLDAYRSLDYIPDGCADPQMYWKCVFTRQTFRTRLMVRIRDKRFSEWHAFVYRLNKNQAKRYRPIYSMVLWIPWNITNIWRRPQIRDSQLWQTKGQREPLLKHNTSCFSYPVPSKGRNRPRIEENLLWLIITVEQASTYFDSINIASNIKVGLWVEKMWMCFWGSLSILTMCVHRPLNSNPPLFLCLNTSFVFTNYQPIQRSASHNRAVRIMHRYFIIQHEFHVPNTIY